MKKDLYLTDVARQANEISRKFEEIEEQLMKNTITHYVLPEIARRAKTARQLSGLTQEDVAAAVGVTHAAVSLFESGKIASFWLLTYYVAFLHLDLERIWRGAE